MTNPGADPPFCTDTWAWRRRLWRT